MVVVIGAGISGLAVGEYLKSRGVPFVILEAEEKPGGKISTFREGPYVFENGPNSFQMTPAISDFLQLTGFQEFLVEANPEASKTRYFAGEKLEKLPANPIRFLFSGILSFAGKLRLLKESIISRSFSADESVFDFFERRFGKEIADKFTTPLVSGIYAGDPKKLLISDAFSAVKALEMEFGSVLRGLGKKGKTKKGSFSFRNGMNIFTQYLTTRLKEQIIYKTVTGIHYKDKELQVIAGSEVFSAKNVVITIPAYEVSKLIEDVKPINYAPLKVVHSVYNKSTIGKNINGFGMLNSNESFSLGTIFVSTMFPDRCPKNEVVFTTFVGGILNPVAIEMSDEKVEKYVHEELSRLLEITGDPILQKTFFHPNAIPQFDEKRRETVSILPELEEKGIYFAGNWVSGVSIGNCVEHARRIASEIAVS